MRSSSIAHPHTSSTEALKLVCKSDKEFKSWLQGQHPTNKKPVMKGRRSELELNRNPCTRRLQFECVRTQRPNDGMARAKDYAVYRVGIGRDEESRTSLSLLPANIMCSQTPVGDHAASPPRPQGRENTSAF